MIVPESNLRSVRRGPAFGSASTPKHAVAWALGSALVLGGAGWVGWVYANIRDYARHDEARPADAIAVFGAAEYDGRPSPVLRSRLEHGLELYQQKLAPLVITLGGGDPQDRHSEGGVGKDFLLAHGVPERDILAETQSDNTEQSAERLAVIARANDLKSIVVVSDGTHLFRIHALCKSEGLQVYTSPRQAGRSIGIWRRFERTAHEVLSYTLWRMHLH